MTESTLTAKGQTTVPADIRRRIGGVAGTRLVWHVLADGRLFVRVKNKYLQELTNMLTPTEGLRVKVEEMNPWA